KLADILGGEFMEFDKANKIGLNPFSLIEDYDEEADMLEGLIAAMAAPNERLTDLQKAGVSRGLRQAFADHGRQTTIDHVIEHLLADPDQRLKDVGQQLYPFSSQGSFGGYFNAGNTISFTNDLTVLELEHLRNRRHLQKVVLLQLIYQIQQAMYLGDRGRPKLVIIDEAWDLLTDGDVGKFIEHGYRRFRKYNGAAVTITQSLGDLYGSQVGQAVVDNSANMFLLGQKPETINSLASSGRLPLSSFGVAQLRTVHTQTGRFSEIYCHTSHGSGVGRLVVSPFIQLLYSTLPADTAAIQRHRDRGLDIADAINAVLEERRGLQREAAA
ncbi:MAG: ATP-binding protein, partial [Geminicoccaceae bacterium]